MPKNQPFNQLFRNTNFLKLWVSQILSQLTINIMNFYILTRIYTATHSTIAVSLIWIASSIPSIIFGPFSGTLVDSFSRRKMLVITNLLQAAIVALALLIPGSKIFPLYVIVFLYWFLDLLYLPSQQASVPWLVDKKLLPAANGVFVLTQQASLLVGFGLGGLLLSLLGNNLTVIICSLNLVIAALSVFLLPKDHPHTTKIDDIFKFWRDLKQGINFLKSHRMVGLPLAIIIVSQVFISVIAITLPSYTSDVLGLDLNHAGVALVIPGCLGALFVTYLLPRWLKSVRKKQAIETGFLMAGISLLLMFSISFLPFSKSIVAALVAVGLGSAVALITVPAQTLIQQYTPAWFRGRVYAHLNLLLVIATTLPVLAAATVADAIGVAGMMGVIGLLSLLGYFLMHQKGDYVLANGLGL